MPVTSTSGQGRKKGNLNRATREIKSLAQPYGPGAVAVLARLAGLIEGQPPAESEPARIMACKELLDRAYGKATQPIVGDDEQPIAIHFTWASAPPPAPAASAASSTSVIDAEPEDNGALTIEWTTEGK
jgi:hypothetical protein